MYIKRNMTEQKHNVYISLAIFHSIVEASPSGLRLDIARVLRFRPFCSATESPTAMQMTWGKVGPFKLGRYGCGTLSCSQRNAIQEQQRLYTITGPLDKLGLAGDMQKYICMSLVPSCPRHEPPPAFFLYADGIEARILNVYELSVLAQP